MVSHQAARRASRCATCGQPENDHPYRHPFVALAPMRATWPDCAGCPMPDRDGECIADAQVCPLGCE